MITLTERPAWLHSRAGRVPALTDEPSVLVVTLGMTVRMQTKYRAIVAGQQVEEDETGAARSDSALPKEGRPGDASGSVYTVMSERFESR